ncbi:hypothetical protein MNB_ARC-1_198 [hydrothermal vent metagenome]|uniref:Uncharacterized protein n=1 Tax=hydrothermal vent metagenome TaxID=652676 RepID=A0A3B1DSP1_9ZZZZ
MCDKMSIIDEKESRDDLIVQIKHLISITGEETYIDAKLLEYFQDDELKEIRNNLEYSKIKQKNITNDYLDELYEKHTKT